MWYIGTFRLPVGTLSALAFDVSKWYALNVFAQHGLELGRDIAHNHGPLGFLWYPVAAAPGSFYWGYSARAIMTALLLIGVAIPAISTRRYANASLMLLVIITLSVRAHIEGLAIGICLIFLLLSLIKPKVPYYGVAALMAGLSFCMKLNVGIISTALFCLFVLADFMEHREWKRVAIHMVVLMLCIGVIGLFSYGSFANFSRWFSLAMTMADARSHAAALFVSDTSLFPLIIGMAVAYAWLATVMYRSTKKSYAFFWIVASSMLLLLFFKHAFGRQGAHLHIFFRLVPFVCTTSLFLVPMRKCIVPLIAIVSFSVLASTHESYPAGGISKLKTLQMNFQGIQNIRNIDRKKLGSEISLNTLLANKGLTANEQAIVSGSTLNVYPYHVVLVHNTSARWLPSPVFQDLLVNQKLDDLNAEHIQGNAAAQHQILVWRSPDNPRNIDKAHMFQVSPASFRAIAQNYQPVYAQSGRILLERRLQKDNADMHLVSSVIAQWNSPVEIPVSQKPLIAKVDARYSLLGKLKKTVFRIEPVTMHILYPNQSPQVFRLNPSTSKNGVIAQYLPRTAEEADAFLRHSMPATMEKAHSLILKKRDSSFLPEVTIDFYEWDWPLE